MSLFSTLKHNARLALRGSWGRAILTLLITMGASALLIVIQGVVHDFVAPQVSFNPYFIMRYGVDDYFFQQLLAAAPVELALTAGFTLLRLLLLAPLGLGILRWFYELVHGRSRSIAEIFHYFESGGNYLRAVWMRVNLMVRYSLWALAFFLIPCGVLGASVYIVSRGEEATRSMMALASVGVLLSWVLFALAAIFYLAFTCKYLLAEYLLCEDDNLSVGEAIRTSVSYTKGYQFSLLGYQLTFFGWLLLCGFILPVLYVYPYLNTALAMYARYIIEKARFAAPRDSTREFVVDHMEYGDHHIVRQPGAVDVDAAAPPAPSSPAPVIDEFQFPESRVPFRAEDDPLGQEGASEPESDD